MPRHKTPPALGTIWPHGCKIQVIGDDNRWKTLSTCLYTPRHINDELKRHNLSWAFVYGPLGRETYHAGDTLAVQK